MNSKNRRFRPLIVVIAAILTLAGCSQLQSPTGNQATANSSERGFGAAFRSFGLGSKPAANDPDCQPSADALDTYTASYYNNLWHRIEMGFAIPESSNATPGNRDINTHLNWYLQHPHHIKQITARASRYMYHIVNELEARELPTELALLPIIESSYDPFAYSPGRASGLWQFIPATGSTLGLKQNWWYDGRRDVVASTDAALRYLIYLNKRFDGDWLLTLAAYNSGEGTVSRAIQQNNAADKPTDFWSLNLPPATKTYVPRLLALAKLIQTQDKTQLPPVPNQPYFTVVDIGSQMDFAQAAKLAKVDINELYLLNAGFNRWATDPKGPHRLLLPVKKADAFSATLATLSQQDRMMWERHQVKSGDTLDKIANHYNTTVASLKETNKLRSSMIRPNQVLLIPAAGRKTGLYNPSQQRIASNPNRAQGQTGPSKTTYLVKNGDSLWKIANTHQVHVAELAKWNGITPKDPLQKSQKLVIWTEAGAKASGQNSSKQSNGITRKVAYQVRSGDSLALIAGKFKLSVNDIVRWNSIQEKHTIHPGQSLTLFIRVATR